jgi:hypothetical protein
MHDCLSYIDHRSHLHQHQEGRERFRDASDEEGDPVVLPLLCKLDDGTHVHLGMEKVNVFIHSIEANSRNVHDLTSAAVHLL